MSDEKHDGKAAGVPAEDSSWLELGDYAKDVVVVDATSSTSPRRQLRWQLVRTPGDWDLTFRFRIGEPAPATAEPAPKTEEGEEP